MKIDFYLKSYYNLIVNFYQNSQKDIKMDINEKVIKNEQEISIIVRKMTKISVTIFAIAMVFLFFAAVGIPNNHFGMFTSNVFACGVLLWISLTLLFWTNLEMKFVSSEEMLEMSNEIESFPEIKAEFCKIIAVRPFLTFAEYHLINSKIKEAKEQRDTSIWELKKKSICTEVRG